MLRGSSQAGGALMPSKGWRDPSLNWQKAILELPFVALSVQELETTWRHLMYELRKRHCLVFVEGKSWMIDEATGRGSSEGMGEEWNNEKRTAWLELIPPTQEWAGQQRPHTFACGGFPWRQFRGPGLSWLRESFGHGRTDDWRQWYLDV